MRLNERRWLRGGGLTPEWAWVGRRRVEDALSRLEAIAAAFMAKAPPSARRRRYADGLRYFLRRRGRDRDRLAAHPCFDYWLYLWDKHFPDSAQESDWHLQFGLFQGFAASLALSGQERVDIETASDPDGRFYLFGSPYYLEFPGGGLPFRLSARGKRLSLFGPGGAKAAFEAKGLPARPEDKVDLGGAVLRRLPEVAPGMVVDDRGWLMVHGVVMHGLARLDDAPRLRFTEVLKTALAEMAQRDPDLHAEISDMVHALIPLNNPMNHGSVSSSYVNARGAICLSHSEDPLLQAETLIHEFCHQKMNQLLVVDPILLPGQSGQVFYSPWREDARRLRGLLLGAHAFLNVSRYLSKSLAREPFPEEQQIEIMVNVARRALQVEAALRGLAGYGSFSEFGSRFLLGLWRELAALQQAIQWFPPALLKEQREACDEHRKRHELFDTGLHKDAGFVDKVRRVAFLTPKSADEISLSRVKAKA